MRWDSRTDSDRSEGQTGRRRETVWWFEHRSEFNLQWRRKFLCLWMLFECFLFLEQTAFVVSVLSHLFSDHMAQQPEFPPLFNFCFSEPVFVGSSLDPAEKKLYFFFSEVGKEFSYINELRVARVAQICKVTANTDSSPMTPVKIQGGNSLACFTGWRRRTEDSTEEVDVLRQSPCSLSVSQTASLQRSPGRVHSAATSRRRQLRNSVLRRVHLSVVGTSEPGPQRPEMLKMRSSRLNLLEALAGS